MNTKKTQSIVIGILACILFLSTWSVLTSWGKDDVKRGIALSLQDRADVTTVPMQSQPGKLPFYVLNDLRSKYVKLPQLLGVPTPHIEHEPGEEECFGCHCDLEDCETHECSTCNPCSEGDCHALCEDENCPCPCHPCGGDFNCHCTPDNYVPCKCSCHGCRLCYCTNTPGNHGDCKCHECNPCTINGHSGAPDDEGSCYNGCDDSGCNCDCHKCPECKECWPEATDHAGHKCNTCNPCVLKRDENGKPVEHGDCYVGCDKAYCNGMCDCHKGKIKVLGWAAEGEMSQRWKYGGWGESAPTNAGNTLFPTDTQAATEEFLREILRNIYEECENQLSDTLQETITDMLAEGSNIVEFFNGVGGYTELLNELLELELAIGDGLEEVKVTTKKLVFLVMIIPPGESVGEFLSINANCDAVGRAYNNDTVIMPGDSDLIQGLRDGAKNQWEGNLQTWIDENQESVIKEALGESYEDYIFE